VPDDVVPASRKLGRDDAIALAAKVSMIVAAKGKKIATFKVADGADDEAIDAMLGPTGNLRSPTIRAGKTLLVGFHEEQFAAALLD
jgi:arsenate reductase-like glutaredoxin family protein